MSNAPRTEPWRPQWHFSAQRHWINDPNGLICFDGEYHLFFQTNPFGNQWGHMSWGHAVSTDLLNWQELPVAIPEDERTSIFSGSVVLDRDNTSGFGQGGVAPLVAIYTGCLRRPEGGQAQEIASSTDRGRTWAKYAGNPVLDLGLRDFRDPKVFWHAPSGRWVMVVVLPDERRARFYASSNLKDWAWLSDFDAPFEGQGIWECPDLIPLPAPDGGTVWLFKVDVFAGHPSGDAGARIFFGHFDGTRFVAEPESEPRWADWGADFYAALSWADTPDGRALWLAWQNCHRVAKHLPTEPFRGAMSVPRELSVMREGGRESGRESGREGGQWVLRQQPLRELRSLRGEPRSLANLSVGMGMGMGSEGDAGRVDLQALLPAAGDARLLDVELTLSDVSADAIVCLLLRHGPGAGMRVGVDAARGTVFVDRSQAGFAPPGDVLWQQRRHAPRAFKPGAPLKLRVLLDWASVEVFVGEGQACLSEQILPDDAHQGLALQAERGSARCDITVWPLRAARFDSMTGEQ
jgi:sucrose-6-phosphate hydrolase SacC (GH32 family)